MNEQQQQQHSAAAQTSIWESTTAAAAEENRRSQSGGCCCCSELKRGQMGPTDRQLTSHHPASHCHTRFTKRSRPISWAGVFVGPPACSRRKHGVQTCAVSKLLWCVVCKIPVTTYGVFFAVRPATDAAALARKKRRMIQLLQRT